ncbi:unnamed protein product [Bursaphelenchus xylophilus]|uniref:Origin recognition complex subunit 2 n=1 Tax=Bursaphelenchus xylophilus TaxID=6326 RepID=A0A1I7SVV4_BURXY|nr:unnamed protein product [Bursaphelenchus xylophilus]CAG9098333.1 unnamed protein product [Bursaphelenchus xylophilus]
MDESGIEEQENIPQLYRKSKKPQIDINKVLEYINDQEDEKSLSKKYGNYFDEWLNYLMTGFNIKINGRGSKIDLVESFLVTKKINKKYVYQVMGHEPDVNLYDVFSQIVEHLNLNIRLKRESIIMQADKLGEAIEEKKNDFLLVVHNVDGRFMRNDQAMEALNKLGAHKHIRMILTLAFPYGDIYWNPDIKYCLKLIEYNINTYRIDFDELLALNPKLESHNGKSDTYHTLESLDMIWTSLASNTQKICTKLYEMWLLSENKAVSFFELFTEVRNNFLTTSEVVLSTQITELKDHYFISINDEKIITFTVDPILLAQFMEKKISI